jgi:hypothetical protein
MPEKLEQTVVEIEVGRISPDSPADNSELEHNYVPIIDRPHLSTRFVDDESETTTESSSRHDSAVMKEERQEYVRYVVINKQLYL